MAIKPKSQVQEIIEKIQSHNKVLRILNAKQPGNVEFSAEDHVTYEEYLIHLEEEPEFSLPEFNEEVLSDLRSLTLHFRSHDIHHLMQSQSKEGWEFRQALSSALPYFAFDTYQKGSKSIECFLPEEMLENPYIKLLFGIE